ncbi:MAG: c-type cytochrome [Phycisphaerales bacterium]|nr:c-type cytochrome [Phycisphaerales bacterium]
MTAMHDRLSSAVRVWCALILTLAAGRGWGQQADRFELAADESVALVGNSFAERLAMSGYLEALLQSAFPGQHIRFCAAPWSGDEVGEQDRELNVPDTDARLHECGADVVFACFGMSESFRGVEALPRFEADLRSLLRHYREAGYGDRGPTRVVLVSPISHEWTGAAAPGRAEIDAHNGVITEYERVMRRVAGEEGARFVGLSSPSAVLSSTGTRLTTDGILPSEVGCWAMAREIGSQLGWVDAAPADAEHTPEAAARLRTLAWDKFYHYRELYRPTNTEYIWGRRAEPFGVVSFPPEQEQLRRMVDARQRAIWDLPKPTPEQLFAAAPTGGPVWETTPSSHDFPEDDWTPPPVDAKGTETSVGDTTIKPSADFARAFKVADGYAVECFASEEEFPELQNPLAIAFDDRHRLWVLCSPTYPHVLPGERPHDRLIVLSDEDHDGRADRCETFADGFGVATGFAIDSDGVYLAVSPDLFKLRDTDGDGKADRREVVLTGFCMPDSHHQISALEWAPDGGFYLHEGTFGRAAVETPFGTVRARDAAVWRFEPTTGRLQVLSHCGFPNPWGHAFDDFGASVLDSTSGGEHFYFSHVSTAFDYPSKPAGVPSFLTRGRPTAGNEIIASRAFPPEVQGSHLVNQMIGFHGTRWDMLSPAGSGWRAEAMPQDLIQSSDENFRPVALKIGPDGTLFICDWCNPLIGHMQYSVRDPRRDHTHGRIWRVRSTTIEPLTPPEIHSASAAQLLELLRLPERNTRQLVRRRLQTMPAAAVQPVLDGWLGALDAADPLHDRLVLEALWIEHGLGRFDTALLGRVIGLASPDARAAGLRMLRIWLMSGEIDGREALLLIEPAVRDADERVRLEAVIDCGFAGGPEAGAIAQAAAELEMDESFQIVLTETLKHLAKYGETDSLAVRRLKLRAMGAADLASEPWDDAVATVVLERADVSPEARLRALETLAPDVPDRAAALVAAVLRAREPGPAAAGLLPLLRGAIVDRTDVAVLLAPMLEHPGREVRAAGTACLLGAGDSLENRLGADPQATVDAFALLPERQISEGEASRLRNAVDAGNVEPGGAVAILIDRAEMAPATEAWLQARIGEGASLPFDRWGREHEVAMAVLRAVSLAPSDRLPEGLLSRRIGVDAARLEAGRAVYTDEALGCVRCHGARGQGEPGFPPLDRSPYVLGDPRRAAAIVVHGLQGEVRVRGVTIQSVMPPLGAVLTDQQIADALTFVRQSWGNFAAPVHASDVATVRARPMGGTSPMAATALLVGYPLDADRLIPTHAVPPPNLPGGGASVSVSPLAVVILLLVAVAVVALVLQRWEH